MSLFGCEFVIIINPAFAHDRLTRFGTLPHLGGSMFGRCIVRLAATAMVFIVAHSASAAPATHFIVSSCFPLFAPCAASIHTTGQPFTFWVFAVDTNNQLATGYTGAASITSSDLMATLPPQHLFTAADNSAVQFTITINSLPLGNGNPTQVFVAATDTNGLTGSGVFFVSVAQPVPTLSAGYELALFILLCFVALISLRTKSPAKPATNHSTRP